MTTLVEHFERYLGPITVGWSENAEGEKLPFQIVRFERGSGPGVISFATLGLSRYPLTSPTSGRLIHHELMVLAPESLQDGPIPGLLDQVAQAALRGNRALVRGDVIGPHGPLIPGSSLEALYVAMPAYFPDDFATFEGGHDPIVIAWLVPISRAEASFVAQRGWGAFEDVLVEQNPDLTDFYRGSTKL